MKNYKKWDMRGFAEYFHSYPFRRRVTGVHLHHTWLPNHKHYKGLKTIQAMARYHIKTNGWGDIAQHLSIGPDGSIWEGRNWNKKPVSIRGYNGNNRRGPIAIEMIGNFDKGYDKLEGKQLEAVLFVISFIQERLNLPSSALTFHAEHSSKTCPGTSLSKSKMLEQVEEYKNKNFR